jgi:hypothetical protein
MSEIYSGLASFGKVQTLFGLVFVGILFLILISIGAYLIASNSKYKKIIANVTLFDCKIVNQKYDCEVNISYIIDSKIYTNKLTFNGLNSDLNLNDTVEIEYNIKDPTSIRQPSFNKYLGWILIGIAIFILVFGIISTILVFKFKPYAAYTGFKSIIPSGTGSFVNIRV